MRKIRELLRLKFDLGLSIHKIAASLSIARSTVTECLRRAADAGVAWPLAHELDDELLEARLYPKRQAAPNVAMPDFAHLLEPHFDPDSYGYRPSRSAKDAVRVTRQRCWKYDWVQLL